ncbi:MAG: sensor histidine kinase [Eubacteriales bacterium]
MVIGTAELASRDTAQQARVKLDRIEELLTGSLNDLRNTFTGVGMRLGQTSLTKALGHLKNDSISVDIKVHGRTYELDGETTQAVYRLCQEAVTNAIKHGRAKNIYIILRYWPQEFEVYAVDNGIGCGEIKKSFGLEGIEKRITGQGGRISFASDGECGFTVHAGLPRKNNLK